MKRAASMVALTILVFSLPCTAWSLGGKKHSAFSKEQLAAASLQEENGDHARAQKDLARARSFYLDALRIKRSDAILYNKLGIIELQLKEFGQAQKHLQQAMKYDPQNIVILNNNGVVLCLKKHYAEALVPLKQALALEESYASAHLNLAEAWSGLGYMDRAMTEYSRALELDPDILNSANNGTVLNLSTPEQRARMEFIIARSYAIRGNVEVSLEHLQRAKDEGFNNLDLVYKDAAFTPLWQSEKLAHIVKRH